MGQTRCHRGIGGLLGQVPLGELEGAWRWHREIVSFWSIWNAQSKLLSSSQLRSTDLTARQKRTPRRRC